MDDGTIIMTDGWNGSRDGINEQLVVAFNRQATLLFSSRHHRSDRIECEV